MMTRKNIVTCKKIQNLQRINYLAPLNEVKEEMLEEYTKFLYDDKEKHQTEVELGIFWDIFSRALPKSRARNEIGDEKLFIALKITFIQIKKYLNKKL